MKLIDTIRILSGGVTSAFDPLLLFDGLTDGAYYDPSNLATLFQDVSGLIPVANHDDPVALMLDLSGNNNHAVISVSAYRPRYQTDGTYHWLLFDQVDDRLDLYVPGNGVQYTSVASSTHPSTTGVLFSSLTVSTPFQFAYTAGSTLAAIVTGTSTVESLSIDKADQSLAITRGDLQLALATSSVVAIEWTPFWAGATLSMGRYGGGGGFPGMSKFYGRLDIARTLTAGEMSSLETFMADKQGVVL